MKNEELRRGFTLVEMLVVIGIIAILVGASIGGFSHMARTALYQQEGNWPKRLALNGATDGVLDENAALPLARGKYISLSTTGSGKNLKLAGADRFGIVTPWAAAVIKRRGTSATLSDPVGIVTVKDHLLHYALDLDGDGVIKGASVGGKSVDIRATAAVWCGGKDGVISPYPYGGGGARKGANETSSGRSDDVWSWTPGQTKDVQ